MKRGKLAKFRQKRGTLGDFPRITRPKGGVLKVARPAQTSPNGQIPVQNDAIWDITVVLQLVEELLIFLLNHV